MFHAEELKTIRDGEKGRSKDKLKILLDHYRTQPKTSTSNVLKWRDFGLGLWEDKLLGLKTAFSLPSIRQRPHLMIRKVF